MKHRDNSNIAKREKPVTSTRGLVEAQLVPFSAYEGLAGVEAHFSVRATPQALSAIEKKEAADPVFAQYVPSLEELNIAEDDLEDPIGDGRFEVEKGLTHRYPDRVLLKPTHTCHVYCRFCFRREKVGHPEESLKADELDRTLDYIRSNDAVWEVILSGGDPLVLSDRRIGALMDALAQIDHVAIVRIHTRAPLVEPERITDDLIEALKRSGKAVYIVIHTNHANELTAPVRAALARLANAGIPLLAQTVLLKGINDDAATLATLFRTLTANRVKPYYLHHLDKARGVGHFRVSVERGQEIMRALRGTVSGLCQPTYVLDIPGGNGKVPIGPTYLSRNSDGSYTVSDYLGGQHRYADPAADQ